MSREETLSIEEALAKFGTVIRPVEGDSMLPMLNEDTDRVRLVPAKGILSPYDLPLYRRPNGKLVLHRILKVKKKVYLIAGDNRTQIERVPHEWVIAVTEGYYKNGNYIPVTDPDYQRYVEERCRDVKGRERIVKEPRIPAEWSYLLALLKAALHDTGAPVSAPDGLKCGVLLSLAKQQSVLSLVSPYLDPAAFSDEQKKGAALWADAALRREILYAAERRKVLSALEEAGVAYLPLKGIRMTEFYTGAGKREFADNDILYDNQKQKVVERVMNSLGFRTTSLHGVHDSYDKEPIFHFEMHKWLYDPKSKLGKTFADPFTRAKKDEENAFGYHMTDEDFFLHFVGHFFRHYENSGSGIRSFCDLWLLDRKLFSREDFDRAYVEGELSRAGLSAFLEKARKLAEIFFGDGGEKPPFADLCYIFTGGTYGSTEHRIENGLQKKGKVRYILSRAFIPYSLMALAHPILRPLPFLLPVFWIVRLVSAPFSKGARRNIKAEFSVLFRKKKNP